MSDQPQPTHINAYRTELAEAERELAQAQGKVDGLKETIATMEAADKAAAEAPADPNAVGSDVDAVEGDEAQSAKDLEKLKRDELEKEAEAAGVPNPEDSPNKATLAADTAAAQAANADSAPAAPVATEDAADLNGEPRVGDELEGDAHTVPEAPADASTDAPSDSPHNAVSTEGVLNPPSAQPASLPPAGDASDAAPADTIVTATPAPGVGTPAEGEDKPDEEPANPATPAEPAV